MLWRYGIYISLPPNPMHQSCKQQRPSSPFFHHRIFYNGLLLNSTSLVLELHTMANAPSPPHYSVYPVAHAIQDMANGAWYEDYAGSSTTHESIGRSIFPFLRLPLELQVNVADQISLYSDLKAFILISKELYDVATPSLYKTVNLRSSGHDSFGYRLSEGEADELLLRKIESLLMKPENLLLIRVLKTNRFGWVSTQLMDKLLPLLRENFLTEFNYSTQSLEHFPTPSQLQFLWGHQKKLRNLKINSHIVLALEEFFSKSELNQTGLLKSFTKLAISDNSEMQSHDHFNIISWPLNNLDLSLIQHLSFNGQNNTKASNIVSSLNPLFSAGCFGSLMKLTFKWICFDETLKLTNMPSLKRLSIIFCRARPGQPLVQACNIQLRYLMHMGLGPLEEIYLFLNQIQGLEDVVIVCPIRMSIATRLQTALMNAISLHKKTLRKLDLELHPILETNICASIWDASVMEIQDCKNLVKLWLPLTPTKPTSYYRDMIAALPRLSSLIISTARDFSAKWSPNLARDIFPVSTELSSIRFDTYSQETYRIIRRDSNQYFKGLQ